MSAESSVRFKREDQLQHLAGAPVILIRYATIRV
jgi:hypothetical protein